MLYEPSRAFNIQLDQIEKTPLKIRLKKLVNLTGHTWASNSLTNFEYESHEMTGNRSYANLLKLVWKNS